MTYSVSSGTQKLKSINQSVETSTNKQNCYRNNVNEKTVWGKINYLYFSTFSFH